MAQASATVGSTERLATGCASGSSVLLTVYLIMVQNEDGSMRQARSEGKVRDNVRICKGDFKFHK